MSNNDMKLNKVEFNEREITSPNGGKMLVVVILELILSIASMVFGVIKLDENITVVGVILLAMGIIGIIVFIILCCGFHVVNPNEAMVFTLFGNYHGTIKKAGFFFINPFAATINPTAKARGVATTNVSTNGNLSVKKKVSTKVMTLNNETQKVNDVLGNPIIIGAIVIWNVEDPTKAVFNVENYMEFLSTQCDSTIRNVARLYPYDTMENDSDEKTLRGSSQEIADSMRDELQERVKEAGLNIKEVRITHLSYSEEIAAAMLQRQQAVAIIAARQKIVEGAVTMVKMAIDQLGEEEIVVLDEERKAAMVSNLLVVLCGNKDAQPIVNSGSIY